MEEKTISLTHSHPVHYIYEVNALFH